MLYTPPGAAVVAAQTATARLVDVHGGRGLTARAAKRDGDSHKFKYQLETAKRLYGGRRTQRGCPDRLSRKEEGGMKVLGPIRIVQSDCMAG